MTATQNERYHFHRLLTDVRLRGVPSSTPRNATTPTAEAKPAEPAPPVPTIDPQKIERLLANIARSVDDYSSSQKIQVEELRAMAVSLGTSIARHIVGQAVDAGQFNLEPLLSKIAGQLDEGNAAISVRLNPEDLSALQEESTTATIVQQLELVADPALQRGSCIATQGQKQLLSTIEQRLDDAERLLKKGIDDAWS